VKGPRFIIALTQGRPASGLTTTSPAGALASVEGAVEGQSHLRAGPVRRKISPRRPAMAQAAAAGAGASATQCASRALNLGLTVLGPVGCRGFLAGWPGH
jgi:hypothetical protein